MIVISRDCEDTDLWLEPRERVSERSEVAPHRVGSGKIIAGQENQIRSFPIDFFNREIEPLYVLIHIEMKIADLTRDYTFQRRR
jgi:hypothetical protein